MSKFAILCIDDELVVLDSLKEQLKRHFGKKYYIEVAGDGLEALEIFEELTAEGIEVSLAISDAHMPDMKGDEILIKIHEFSPNTLKILLTGRASADVVGNAVNQANLYRYIAKPWDETDLILTVTEALRRYEQERELAQKNEALRQLNASLEQKVIDRTAQLENAQKAAEAANRTKSQFIANMSHELRTPLNAILGFSQILANEDSLTALQRENIEIINRSGEHLLTLINDILSISKIEAGRTVLYESCFNLHELLEELYQMLHLRAKAKELQLVFDLADNLPQYIQADESKLRQVLINLLGNAIKFTPQGKAILRVSLGRETQPKSEGEPIFLHFEVQDTGVGIAMEDLDRLFEPFIQTRTGYAAMEGTGLGLPISREFVRIMGGEITVRSAVGLGSSFTFDVRARTCSAVEVERKPHRLRPIALATPSDPYRILIAEDVEENRKMLVRMLEPLGFKVKEAENGREAIALWRSWQPHLIFMDMRMPAVDGYQATRTIGEYARATSASTIIIALTASAFEEDRQAIFAAGCVDILVKPLQENLLWQKLEQYLGVRYLYSEEQPRPTCEELSKEQTEQALSQMPSEALVELHQAALEINYEKINSSIAIIAIDNSALAHTLTVLVDDYRLDTLLELIQSVWRMQTPSP